MKYVFVYGSQEYLRSLPWFLQIQTSWGNLQALKHRIVAWEKYGDGPFRCFWCGCAIRWVKRVDRTQILKRPSRVLEVDHLDGNGFNLSAGERGALMSTVQHGQSQKDPALVTEPRSTGHAQLGSDGNLGR